MKQLKIYKIFLLLLISSLGLAQGEFNHWHFGNNASLDFNSGTAVSTTGSALSTGEGCASISDRAGNLLFYTDGSRVWDRNNILMSGGTGLLGNPSSTTSAIIVPRPGSSLEYYISL